MKKAIILIPLLSGFAFMAVVSLFAYSDEMRPQDDPHSLYEFLFRLGCSVFFALMALIFGACALVKVFRKSFSGFGVFGLCALISVALPIASFQIADPISKAAKMRYVDRFGREALRAEVAALLARSEQIEGDISYLGKQIAVEDIPPLILKFSRGAEIELNEYGIVYRTHGLGSWRGGYMITPTGSDQVPENFNHTKITDGFYYVVSN